MVNKTLAERAEEVKRKIRLNGSCWEYPTQRRAYLTVEGSQELVYRIAYKAWKGDIPEGLNVLHTCDNKSCCNPLHLELGTQRQNVLDAVDRALIASQSPLPGVSWQQTRKRWLVMPRINGQKQCLYVGKDFFEAACKLKAFQASFIPRD